MDTLRSWIGYILGGVNAGAAVFSLGMSWYNMIQLFRTGDWIFLLMAILWFILDRAFLQECEE